MYRTWCDASSKGRYFLSPDRAKTVVQNGLKKQGAFYTKKTGIAQVLSPDFCHLALSVDRAK